jgi:hypothetical protein
MEIEKFLMAIGIFIMVISTLYCLRHGFSLIVELKKDKPTPIKLSVIETILLYLSLSTVITGLFLIIFR